MDGYHRNYNHFSPGYSNMYEGDFVPNTCYKSYEGGYAPQFWPHKDTHDRERNEILSFQQWEDEYGSPIRLGSRSLSYPQELNYRDNEPYPYDNSYYEDYSSYHDYHIPKEGNHFDWKPEESYSQPPYSEFHSNQLSPSRYCSSLPPQNAHDFESALASYAKEHDARLEACATSIQNIKSQLEHILQLASEIPQDIPPNNIDIDPLDATILGNEFIEQKLENQVEGLSVEDTEMKEKVEKSVDERIEVEEQVEKPFLATNSQEKLETITLEHESQTIKPELKNQVDEVIVEDNEEEKPIELVEENGEVNEQIENPIMEEAKELEDHCVEPPLSMQLLEPIRLHSEEVKKDSLHEKLCKFLKITNILHFHSPFVYTLLQVPKCDKILKQLSLNRRKMKDLLKKALVGMKSTITNHEIANRMEETPHKTSKLHQLHNKKSMSVPFEPCLILEGEPNLELLRHVATNSKADERVP